jgi:hypothetical protein
MEPVLEQKINRAFEEPVASEFVGGESSEGGNSSVVERQPSKLRVAGSSPVSRSIILLLGC